MIADSLGNGNVAFGALVYDIETGRTSRYAVVYILSGQDGKVLKRLQTDGPIYAMQFTPDEGSLVIASQEPGKYAATPTVVDISTLKVTRTLPPSFSRTNSYTFDPTGRFLVGTSGAVIASLWDFKEGRLIATLNPGGGIRSVSFSPDGTRIVTSATNRTTTIWDSRTGDELFSLRYTPLRRDDQNGEALNDTSVFSRDGTKVIMACTDGAVRVYNSSPWNGHANVVRK